MSLRSEWPCWEIMKCDAETKCPAKDDSAKMCWEIVKEKNNYSFNICMDCLVFICRQKNCQFTREEILSIMAQKGIDVLGNNPCSCPHFNNETGA